MELRIRITAIFFQNDLLMVTRAIIKAIKPPIKGAKKINKITFKISPPAITSNPACATAAPANPPISVCDDEDGIPNRHVNKFQNVAASKPARITQRSIALLSTVFATVFPTLMSKTQNARMLKEAAQITACTGVRTLVETTVAIEFAASWNPFTRSNNNAITITTINNVNIRYDFKIRTVN